ncbi:type VI secretion system lysozyme-related protein [Thiorhodococcus drewsii AZ1]|uniref:Type VI secretion system lysozyme-related protein n=1 Tax=Thiorhodococcus drewsii AZ1 TaxID=765913 RepID=G2E1X2_9GAMM|nr:type VI secretion system baseplate subunit TssE [Thiorhodococcus drewsii]EGV31180.1 type VI secretion system lysozyme-related protein [Thiorhodococcus drewsii AZ1]
MAELTQKERLQPALLDRLTDEEPDKRQESRERRVISMSQLRQSVLRDLAWLLNAGRLDSLQNLDAYPQVSHSVLNYGIPDLTGLTSSGLDISVIERAVRQAVWDFEPRILRHTVQVIARADPERMSHNALTFDIEGELWAQPVPLRIFLKTEFDLEMGEVTVSEASGAGR